MPRKPRPHPVTLTDDWPHVPIADTAGEAARLLAVALREQMGDRSANTIGPLCGLDPVTIGSVLNGTTWVDLRTIVRLEVGLGVALWPRFGSRGAAQEGPH